MNKNNSGKMTILKIIASLVLTISPIALCVELLVDLYYYTTGCFYILFYLVLVLYYLYLIWWKKEFNGENLFLLPLWNKIGLYKDETDLYKLRKKLLGNIAPLLGGTIFLSIIVSALGRLGERDEYGHYSECEITFGTYILVIPIIAWIIFFFKEYGKIWINNSNDKIDMHIFSALQRLKETGSMTEPTQTKNIFERLPKIAAPKWEIKDERPFTQEEIDAIDTAIVVGTIQPSRQVNKFTRIVQAINNKRSVQFTLKGGGMTFIPLDDSSNLNAGEFIDIKKAKLITLGKHGEGDIYRVKD